ncbi:MAG: four helix bundle protein [Candidatus Omnitrophota bacterium]
MQNQNLKFKIKLKDRAYNYSIKIIEFLDTLNKDFSTQAITHQLLRSSTSIGANIIEGQAASSKRDFANFLNHSLKSANESLYWLGLLRDAKKIKDSKLDDLFSETKELANILGASLLTIRGKNKF